VTTDPVTTGPAPTTATTGFAALMKAPLTEVYDFPGPPDKGEVGLSPDKARGRVCYDFQLRETDLPTETHVHQWPVRSGSAVALALHPRVGRPGQTRGGPTDGRGGYVGAQGCEQADGSLIDGLLADPGSYYVEVHTAQAPDGAVRGRLGR
jgi:hypothetical protein